MQFRYLVVYTDLLYLF